MTFIQSAHAGVICALENKDFNRVVVVNRRAFDL